MVFTLQHCELHSSSSSSLLKYTFDTVIEKELYTLAVSRGSPFEAVPPAEDLASSAPVELLLANSFAR